MSVSYADSPPTPSLCVSSIWRSVKLAGTSPASRPPSSTSTSPSSVSTPPDGAATMDESLEGSSQCLLNSVRRAYTHNSQITDHASAVTPLFRQSPGVEPSGSSWTNGTLSDDEKERLSTVIRVLGRRWKDLDVVRRGDVTDSGSVGWRGLRERELASGLADRSDEVVEAISDGDDEECEPGADPAWRDLLIVGTEAIASSAFDGRCRHKPMSRPMPCSICCRRTARCRSMISSLWIWRACSAT